MREWLMAKLVTLMWHRWCSPAWHTRFQYWHSILLAQEMAARRKRGQQEVKMGIYDMTEEELNEHAKRFQG